MKILAISVGGPRQLEWQGRVIHTSILKTPVASRVHVTRLNIDGDQQADLSIHGGPEKAVYAYPAEHYAYWRTELPNTELCWGAFGENLTTEGLQEDEVCIGDRYRMGTAEFVVTQPRIPCYKLGIRFGRMDMIKRFLRCGRSGFYLAVLREGNVGAGDTIERVNRDERVLTVADIVRLYVDDAANQRILEGFYPDFADTSKKPDNGQKECLCRRVESTAGSSNRARLNSVSNRVSAVPRWPGNWASERIC